MTATVHHLPRPSREFPLMPTVNYASLLEEERYLTAALRKEIDDLTAERDGAKHSIELLEIQVDAANAEIELRKSAWLGLALAIGGSFFIGFLVGVLAS